MPRKLRNPKKTRRGTVGVSEALFILLTWDDFRAACATAERTGSNMWELFVQQRLGAMWAAIESDALAEWTTVFPGTRPKNWWTFSAPELRRIHGRFSVVPGNGRCQPTGIPYGGPDDWRDLPMVESSPAFLDRLGLWLPGERDRVPARDFDPQAFSWPLTHAQRGTPAVAG